MDRPSKELYYLGIAEAVARRGTCLRRNYGAVIVADDHIVSTGYTGSPRGTTNCCEAGTCQRVELDIPRGQRYELCRSVHAEMNAMLHTSRKNMMGAVLYLAGFDAASGEMVHDVSPCELCKRLIINAGIERVVAVRPSDAFATYVVSEWVGNQDRELFSGDGY